MKKRRRITIRLGPLGLSLVAAGITAICFAAVSLAANGTDNSGGNGGAQTFQAPAPPGARGDVRVFEPNLSAVERKKMDEFRQCMEDNGAPAPPDPSNIDPSDGPPKPPSAADQEKIQKAWEACKDRLPDAMQNAGPPRVGQCGPPPGPPPAQGSQQNRNQSNQSGTSPSGSSS